MADEMTLRLEIYRKALESIAASACCSGCQEAKLVAKQALAALPVSPPVSEGRTPLQSLAFALGWSMTDEKEIHNFLYRREQMLRMAQAELETHKSNAATAELAIRDRINTLKGLASVSEGRTPEPKP